MKTLNINYSTLGAHLRKPLILEINEPKTQAEEKILQYILDTFTTRGPELAKFTYQNKSTVEVAKHFLFHRSGSEKTLYQTMYCLEKFCKWSNHQPDQLISQCLDSNGAQIPWALMRIKQEFDDFLLYLKISRGLEPVTLRGYIGSMKNLFYLNGVDLHFPYVMKTPYYHQSKAITREELLKVMAVASLRERVVVSILASGGFRIGTLAKLEYRHVKHDLERNVVPLHIPVEAAITKGKYHSYFTFINQEAADNLKTYFELRRNGTMKVAPEEIHDNSPLIRSALRLNARFEAKPIIPRAIQSMLHELYFKAGLMKRDSSVKRYSLRTHSLRKFFQTELSSRGVDNDYIQFMMGHKVNVYNDVMTKGADYLRGVYLTAGLMIVPKERLSRIDALKEIISSWGLDPHKILSQSALAQLGEEQLKNRGECF